MRKVTTRSTYFTNPSIKLVHVMVEQPHMSDTRGDLERLLHALDERCDLEPRVGLAVIAGLQSTLREGHWQVTCVIRVGDAQDCSEIIDILPGRVTHDLFGIAVDIGTTTISAQLCNLMTGAVVASAGIANPQTCFGADLTSRVSYIMMNAGSQATLTQSIRSGLVTLIQNLKTTGAVTSSQIVDAVIVCNPIMHHLYLGIDPVMLGQAPFTAASSTAMSIDARDVGLPIHPLAKIYLLPSITSHVGADAAAVMLSQSPQDRDDITLIVDVGTNAEINLGNRNGLVATSCPTGPAFEGAVISHGQRAAPGAIETVRIDCVTKDIRFKVIGSDLWSDDPQFEHSIAGFGVTGICGSGVIEMVAEMRMAGIIDQTGRLGSFEQTGCRQCFVDGSTHTISLYRGDKHITFTSNDVREVQMAKAALYASIRLLMDEGGAARVDRIVLAGTFGTHISPRHAMVLGLIPDCAFGSVSSVGNAAGEGACRALLDVDERRQIEKLAPRIKSIETAVHPAFQEAFLAAAAIPNEVDEFSRVAGELTLPTVDFRIRKRRAQTKKSMSL